jgi:hypothetical protein
MKATLEKKSNHLKELVVCVSEAKTLVFSIDNPTVSLTIYEKMKVHYSCKIPLFCRH